MQAKLKKVYRKSLPYVMLTLITLLFVYIFAMRNGVFGSKVDWISQHSVLPDYFRQLFYDTKQLFPEFALNIGGGQNIYNFSYYGLYSPVILLSYLMPWVDMGTYIMVSMIVSLVISVQLLYTWLRRHRISRGVSFLTAVLFLLSGPMIYHSYNQIMFVNYMPFLCLALIAVDRYFDTGKVGMYTVSVWLMIMTSFYFSIGGMLVLVIYGIYRYLDDTYRRTYWRKTFLPEAVRFAIPMAAAVMMSGILLIPTASVLLGGRNSDTKTFTSIWKLFIPNLKISGLLYNPYGVGLTALVVVVLIAGLLYKRCSERWLNIACIIVFTIPVFSWALNGGLYIRSKVMIPFIPLLCFMIAGYIEKLRRGRISFKRAIVPYLVAFALLLLGKKPIYMIDAVLLVICFLICYRKKCMQYLILSSIGLLAVYGTSYNALQNKSIDKNFYSRVTDSSTKTAMEKITKEEKGFYRTEQNGNVEEDAADLNRIWSTKQYVTSIYSSVENQNYQNFRTKIFKTEQPYRNMLMQSRSHNSLFQQFMGIKYVVSNTPVPGFKKLSDNVYENEIALPVVYYTNHVLANEQYKQLGYPYNQLALLEYAVAGDMDEDNTNIDILKDGVNKADVRIKNNKIKIEKANEGDVFLLQFKVKNKCKSKDVSIYVDGVKNKLTASNHIYYNGNTEFTYAVPLKEGQTSVKIKFGKGDYQISSAKGYIWKKSAHSNILKRLVQSEFVLDKSNTKGNIIKGKISAGEDDGYLITSIPYDENFKIFVDGKSVTCEKVNTAFLGAKISKGNHSIEIVYHAPGLLYGKIFSIIGLMGLLIICKAYSYCVPYNFAIEPANGYCI